MSDRPTLYAPCSAELLAAVRADAKKKEQTIAGWLRQTAASRLGLPADFQTQPPETTRVASAAKKKLARRGGRG